MDAIRLVEAGQLKKDHLIADLVDAGLPCIEAYHSSHDEQTQRHYLEIAQRFSDRHPQPMQESRLSRNAIRPAI